MTRLSPSLSSSLPLSLGSVEDAPVIETTRLRLRGQRLEDFPAITAIWRDPDVSRHVSGDPLPEEELWTKFLRKTGHWRLLGYGYWVVEEKESGAVIGEAGFGEFKRTITPTIKGEPEIGWVLAASVHGKGFATEAASAAVAWGERNFPAGRMSCIISIANAPSIRVAEKCGFSETARAKYHGDDIVIMHRG